MSATNRRSKPGTTAAPRKTPASGDAGERGPALIVGVGASAGGLDAFTHLLEHLPAAPGFAVVLIQHLQPTHSSELAEILGRKTQMPVAQAENGMGVESNRVYVIPPNAEMRLSGETFVLSPRPSGPTPSMTVDVFLTSLAEQRGDQAIGVILSGSASDGTKGLAAIKAGGGLAFVQDPDTASQSGMPESAIAAGVVDSVLTIEEIARELVRLAEHPYVLRTETHAAQEVPPLSRDDESALEGIVSRVRQSTGLDLTHYKRATLLRRLDRRMAMRRAASMAEYVSLMDADPGETAELLGDVLVRVTSFFRDPETFEALKTDAFPSIMARKLDDEPVRIWVPGCATGQEAYSIAIVLVEYLRASGSEARVQIFASDLREGDLAIARRGVFPPEIEGEITQERLAGFFTSVDGGYRVIKPIREMCLFARHDLTSDPPFARLDLVSCRNLLIYLDSELQRRILGVLHYALVPDGILVLGDSEGVGTAPGLFKGTGHKGILARLPGEARHFAFGDIPRAGARPHKDARLDASTTADREREWTDAQRQLDTMLLDRYAPAAVLVDDRLQVRQIRGDAGEYLRFRPGDATLDLASMVSVGLSSAVTSAIVEARETGRPAHRDAVRPRSEGGHAALDIVVVPIATTDLPMSYAVLFNEGTNVSLAEGESGVEPTEAEYLRQELEAATERLRILREGRDAAYESLQAANEEIQSSNEELQSMNEELDTAKEELQSTNEELTTLNDELQARNAELAQRNDDLDNLLVSASIAMLVLDPDLTIRRFTAQAAHAFNLIAGDVGRRITDIRWRLAVDDVGALVESVVRSGEALEREVTDEAGTWYRLTVRPYMTSASSIGGAILTLLDIDVLRRSQIVLERAALLNEGIDKVAASLGRTGTASRSLQGALGAVVAALAARRAQIFQIVNGSWTLLAESPLTKGPRLPRSLTPAESKALGLDADAQRSPVDESLGGVARSWLPLLGSQGTFLGVLRLDLDGARGGLDRPERDFVSRAAGSIALALERRQHAELLEALVAARTTALTEAIRKLESTSHVKTLFLANVSHELRTPLNSIIGFSSILLDGLAGELNPEQRRQLEMVLTSGKHLLAIVSDLLDLAKITAGAMPVTATEFRLGDVIRTIVELERPIAESKGIELRWASEGADIALVSDEQKARQILLNLVNNAIKFTDAGHVTVGARVTKRDCIVAVEDSGRGMTPKDLELAFKEFEQLECGADRLNDGTGLGLSISTRLAHLLGGSISAKSAPGVGSTFTVVLPLRLPAAGRPK